MPKKSGHDDDDDDNEHEDVELKGRVFIPATSANVGSVVRLRSGGMLLTVAEVLPDDTLRCVGVGRNGPAVDIEAWRDCFEELVAKLK